MLQVESFDKAALVQCGYGQLFDGAMRLPTEQMLMIDRIVEVSPTGGAYGAGQVIAELDIHPALWFFGCHFPGDPVMPGCLGLDALWQLLGFYLAWSGGVGRGRALGVGEVRFSGQILPHHRRVRYTLDIRRVMRRQLMLGVADGAVAVDDRPIYTAKDLKVGLFTSLDDF